MQLREHGANLTLRLRRLWTSARREPWLAGLTLLLLVPCSLLFSVTVRSLGGAIYDVHEWRQGETYSVAYAFIHESASFFYPKHAWRGNLTGIVGMEAPIYPYVVSLLMRVFGDSFLSARLLNFALFVVAFGLQARRLQQRIGLPTALGFLVMAAFSPAVLCEFRQMQPDPAMLSLAVLASVCLHEHGRTGRRASFAWGIALYTLSLLTKPIAIAFLPAMMLFTLAGERRPAWPRALAKLLWFVVPLALMSAWDRWANQLVIAYMEGNFLISIDHDPARMWAEMKNVPMRRFILLGLLENYATHVTLFAAVLVGIPLSMQKPTRSWGLPFLAWLAGAVVISLAFSSRYYTNWYYMLPYVPPILFFGALSLGALFEVVTRGARDPRRLSVALAVVLAGVLVQPLLDEMPWDFVGMEASKMAVHMRRDVSHGPVYWTMLLAAVLGSATLLSLHDQWTRLPHALVALALAVGAVKAMVIPYKDLEQTVRFYTQEERWQQGHDDLRAIRAAVDRYSTPRDLFVMSGSHPGLLTRALRVGWADDPGVIDGVGMAHYVSRGARFFMAFPDVAPPPHAMSQAPVLARGERWELRCLDPRGCPPL